MLLCGFSRCFFSLTKSVYRRFRSPPFPKRRGCISKSGRSTPFENERCKDSSPIPFLLCLQVLFPSFPTYSSRAEERVLLFSRENVPPLWDKPDCRSLSPTRRFGLFFFHFPLFPYISTDPLFPNSSELFAFCLWSWPSCSTR